MQGVFDTYLKSNRFAVDAEKCDSDEDRIKFCTEFLKMKGLVVRQAIEDKVDQTPQWRSAPTVRNMYTPSAPLNAIEVHGEVRVDHYHITDMRAQGGPEDLAKVKHNMRKDVCMNIMSQLIKGDMIEFYEDIDYNMYQTVLRGKLKVFK